MRHLAMALMMLVMTIAVAAQNDPNAPSNVLAWAPAKGLGMYVYPMANQSPYQDLADQNECYESAKQDTGFDPKIPPPPGLSAQQQQAAQQAAAQQGAKGAPKGQALIGGAVGAGGGAAIGAIAGNAGEGAAIGAVAGLIAGRIRRRRAEEQAAKQAAQQQALAQQASQAQIIDQQQAGLNSFRRAFSACMGARHYSAD
jgi:hypothetical protein